MLHVEKRGSEVSTALAEIQRLRKCEAVLTARRMAEVSSVLDAEPRELIKLEREGNELIGNGITLAALDEIMRVFGEHNDDF